jgi:hypothetical protein
MELRSGTIVDREDAQVSGTLAESIHKPRPVESPSPIVDSQFLNPRPRSDSTPLLQAAEMELRSGTIVDREDAQINGTPAESIHKPRPVEIQIKGKECPSVKLEYTAEREQE